MGAARGLVCGVYTCERCGGLADLRNACPHFCEVPQSVAAGVQELADYTPSVGGVRGVHAGAELRARCVLTCELQLYVLLTSR